MRKSWVESLSQHPAHFSSLLGEKEINEQVVNMENSYQKDLSRVQEAGMYEYATIPGQAYRFIQTRNPLSYITVGSDLDENLNPAAARFNSLKSYSYDKDQINKSMHEWAGSNPAWVALYNGASIVSLGGRSYVHESDIDPYFSPFYVKNMEVVIKDETGLGLDLGRNSFRPIVGTDTGNSIPVIDVKPDKVVPVYPLRSLQGQPKPLPSKTLPLNPVPTSKQLVPSSMQGQPSPAKITSTNNNVPEDILNRMLEFNPNQVSTPQQPTFDS